MKAKKYLFTPIILFFSLLISCSTVAGSQKNAVAKTTTYTDLVCGMKVDKSEAYIWKYQNTKYYFCGYDCKHVFEMEPEKYINNKCVDIN